jgi:signal transduction histidine kinase
MTASTGPSTFRRRARAPLVRDAIVALVAFGLTLALQRARGNAPRGLDPLGVVLQERNPSGARAALSTIEDVARETIGEIDQLIRGLRENSKDSATDDGIEPPTGLAAVQELAERHRGAGLPVQITIEGRPRPLAPGLDQAAYRIMQESLTNAARHGNGAAEVTITFGERDLELTVSNPAAASTNEEGGGGHGILGMRERAALLRGSLQAGRGD